jgi:hypothetical protein
MEKCYVSNHHPSIADVEVHWWLLVHSSFHGSEPALTITPSTFLLLAPSK